MVLSIELVNNVWAFAPGDTIQGKVVIDKKIWNKVEGMVRIVCHLWHGQLNNWNISNAGLTIRFYGKIEIGSRTDAFRPPPTPLHPPAASSSVATMITVTDPTRQEGCVATARKIIGGRNIDTEEILLDHTLNLLENCKLYGTECIKYICRHIS